LSPLTAIEAGNVIELVTPRSVRLPVTVWVASLALVSLPPASIPVDAKVDPVFRASAAYIRLQDALSSTGLQVYRYNLGTAGCSKSAKSKARLAGVTSSSLTRIRPIVGDVRMRYAMKQKVFCLGDDYRILDQDGRDVYLVDGKAFVLLRNRLVFLDMAGKELAEIRQRLLSW
jgi:LURP-one-related